MKILRRDAVHDGSYHHEYLKYDGWARFKGNTTPLDLNGCILFTNAEAKLNPPKDGEAYQHYGCYPSIKELK